MKKKKMQAMMAAGPHIPVEVATALIDEIDASDPDSGMGDFGKGAAAALAFLSCGPESRMHGARFADFMANAKAISDRAAEPPEEVVGAAMEVVGAAMEVIAQLEAMGVSVVSAAIVKEVPRG